MGKQNLKRELGCHCYYLPWWNLSIFKISWWSQKTLQWVFAYLLKHCLKAKCSKRILWLESLEYLGYIVSKNRIQVDPANTHAISECSVPTCFKDVQFFSGICNYYSYFIFLLPILLPHFTRFYGKQPLGLGARNNILPLIPLKLHWHMLLYWQYLT